MSTFDSNGYPVAKVNPDDVLAKMEEVAKAGIAKTEELRVNANAARQREAAERAARENTWAGQLGLDVDSASGTAVNTVASLASGASRLAGHVISAPINIMAGAELEDVTDEELAAYDQYKNSFSTEQAKFGPALSRKIIYPGGNATPEQIAQLQAEADANPNAPTALSVLKNADRLRNTGRKINEFFDISKVVDKTKRDELAQDLGDDFKSSWDEVKEGWGGLKDGELLTGSGNVLAGVARLLYNAGEAAVTNPGASTEYIVENAPQVMVGALGRAGAMTLGTSNIGYAAQEYQKGIDEYRKANDLKMPPAEMRREMALYAASLALAEQVGDLSLLKGLKGAGDAATTAGKGGLGAVGKATAGGIATEGLTEGYQTFAEGQISKWEDGQKVGASAQDIYVGGAIGAIAGGGLSGGSRALGELARPGDGKPAAEPTADEAADSARFQEAAAANDPSVYLDAKAKTYDPSKAIGVLLRHAQLPDTSPEVKAQNLTQAGEIVAQLEAERTNLESVVSGKTPEQVKELNDQILAFQRLKEQADPANAAQLDQMITDLNDELNYAPDEKTRKRAETAMSRLDRQLTTARSRMDALAVVVEQPTSPDEVAELVTEVNSVDADTTAPAERVINLSMISPDSLTDEQVNTMISNPDNGLSNNQRNYLRAFSEARIAENKLSTMGKVSQEVLFGSPVGKGNNVGIAQYKARIAAAIVGNSKDTALTNYEQLSKFSTDHQSKAAAAREALRDGLGTQIVRTETGWEVRPAGTMTQQQLTKNGGMAINSGRLVNEIKAEADALVAATREMKFAVGLKFGVQSVSSTANTSSQENQSTQENVEESARPEVKTSELPPAPTPEVLALQAKRKAEAEKRKAREEAKPVVAEEPARVSEANTAPVPEAAPAEAEVQSTLNAFAKRTPKGEQVPYNKRNLVADFFNQDPDATRPLAALKDFASQLRNKLTTVGTFLPKDTELKDEQKALVRDMLASAKAWAAPIKANLKVTNPDFAYTDLMQFLINEDGDVDENVKTAITYGIYSWVAETAGRGDINTPEDINAILLRDEDHIVSIAEEEALMSIGTRQNLVVNALGQRIVQALGLKLLASAPRNLQSQLEITLGAHAMKLMMDQGLLQRNTLTGKEMADLLGKKSTNQFASQYFLKLTDAAQVERIVEGSKGTKGVLDKLFSVDAGMKMPSTSPIPYTQKTTRNTNQKVPAALAKILTKANATPSYVRPDMLNLLGQISDDALLAMAGAVEITEELVHKSRRNSLQAKNDGLVRELENFKEFMKDHDVDAPLYFEHTAWKQQRVGIATNMINPQSSKIHRHMLAREGWTTEIDMADVDAMINFRLRVAEGMGVKTDKQSKEKSLEDFQKLLGDPAVKAAVNVLRKTIREDSDGKLTAAQQEALVAGVQVGGENMHSLSSLMALAHYAEAKATGASTFTIQLMAEVDGVTNGPMLSHLLMGAAGSVTDMFKLLNRGGFYQVGSSYTEYNNWRAHSGEFDLYETTALHMTEAVRDADVDANLMDAIYAFTGELADKDTGAVKKAGRNIIKTPLTAMVFGSSVSSAIDSMADKFIESIYGAIEDQVISDEQIIDHLNTLGVSVPRNASLMEFVFNPNQVFTLKEAFADTLGAAVKTTMEADFAVFIEQRKQFNLTAQMTFDVYNAVYTGMREQMINDLILTGEIDTNVKGGIAIRDLTQAQEKQLQKQLEAIAPVMNTAFSNTSEDTTAGLLIAKGDRKLSTEDRYGASVKFGTPFADNGSESASVHGFEVIAAGPGVAMAPMSVHSSDSNISHTANPDAEALNNHDALGAGVGQILQVAQNLNKATWDTMLNYSPAAEITAALLRTVRGLDALLKQGSVPESVVNNLASVLVDFAQKQEVAAEGVLQMQAVLAQAMAYRADSMKLDTMAEMNAVNQYAMEGGAYTVTSENRSTAASLRSALVVDLSAADRAALESVADRLDKAIKAELAKRDGTTVEKDPEMDQTPVPVKGSIAKMGAPAVVSAPALVKAFSATPVMDVKQAAKLLRANLKDEFSLRLLTALERVVDPSLTITFVTPDTDVNTVLDKGAPGAHAWYVSKGDKQGIYVLSPAFADSGMTPETLLHEMVHAAVAQTIANPTGPAVELVNELNLLLSKATGYAKANGLDKQFSSALENVQELVSWGMTNAEFQNKILANVEMQSTTAGNKLVSGMKAFIDTLVGLIFGRKNDTMSNGLGILVSNVAGLFNQARATRTNSDLVLNQLPPSSTRNYSTMDIFNAIEQNNAGHNVTPEFATHLKRVLDGIVSKLHGPFGTFRAELMEDQAMTPEDVYAQALASGVAPFASDSLAAGFPFTDQEAFVMEQVEVTVREAVTSADGVTSVAYRELAKLYGEVRAKVKPQDFHNGDWATATIDEKDAAQALHDFIFQVNVGADGRSDYLSRFAALGLAHQGFNTLLKNLAPARGNADAAISFNDRLYAIFESITNWFAGKMTNTSGTRNQEAKLTKLVEQLVKIEAKKRAKIESKNAFVDTIEESAEGMSAAVRSRVEKFGKLPFFRNSPSGFVRAAGGVISTYAGDRAENVMEGFNVLRDQQLQSQQGMFASLVNEARGSHVGNVIFHFLLRATKHLEGKRKDLITHTSREVLESFVNKGEDLTVEQKEAITAVFLRTDAASLLGAYSINDLARMTNPLGGQRALQTEIDKLEANLTHKFKVFQINAAKVLAYYKATGKVTDAHLLMNAGNIARAYGTGMQKRITETEAVAAEAVLDPLVSLYALKYTSMTHMTFAHQVMKAELARTDNGNGVEMVLLTHKALQQKSKELLFEGSEALQLKGYTTEIYDPYMQVKVANEVDGADLIAQGYSKGAAVANEVNADPFGEIKHIYTLRDGGLQPHLTGIFSYTGTKAKGSRMHNGNVSTFSYAGNFNAANMASVAAAKRPGINAMFTNTSFDPAAVKSNFMAPVLNANGDVVNYRYLMSERIKDTLLDRDNRPEKILGTLAGSIFDKVTSTEQNTKAIKALHEQYTAEFAERPESYLVVGPNSTDPELREIYNLLPAKTKAVIKQVWGKEGMMVRADLIDMNFGYRKLSIADAFTKAEDERNFVQKMFVEIAESLFDEKAALRVRQSEDVWQAIVKATKSNLVVKSISTMMGNLRSNWSLLLLYGVSPAEVVKQHRVAFKGAWAYRKDSAELFSLENQLSIGYLQPGETKAAVEHKIARLKDSIARNPVKPLIDAGLMPTIVEDVAADEDIYSYKSKFTRSVEERTAALNPAIVDSGKWLLMTEDSSAYKAMSYATQISDFLGRYTLYQAKIAKGMSHEEAIQLASDAFINYDVPTHRMIQYANDSGLVMFTKYYIRIQKTIMRLYRDSPGRVLAMLAVEKLIGAQPTVLDSSMLNRLGNPMNMGALDYPGSLDQLATVKILSSPFSGGGNPTE